MNELDGDTSLAPFYPKPLQLPKMYTIKYVNGSLIAAVRLCFAIAVLLVLLAAISSPADLSFSNLSAPMIISPLLKSLIIATSCLFLGLILAVGVYRKKGTIIVKEGGLCVLNEEFLPFDSLQKYKISEYADRYNLRQLTLQVRGAKRICPFVEDDKELQALKEHIQKVREALHTLPSN